MLAFTASLSAITSVVFGLVPALRAARPNLLPALKGHLGWRIGTGGFRLGKSLVVAQIAVSLVLLVVAGLFVRSLVNLRNLDLGFNPARVLVLNLDMSSSAVTVPLEERRNIYERLVERAESLPGVRAASLSFSGVFSGSSWGNRITVEGRIAPEDEPERTLANSVTPGFFDVMEIRVLRGRPFSHVDRENAPPVAIVNETFAQQFFNDPAPIGRKVGLGAPAESDEGDRRGRRQRKVQQHARTCCCDAVCPLQAARRAAWRTAGADGRRSCRVGIAGKACAGQRRPEDFSDRYRRDARAGRRFDPCRNAHCEALGPLRFPRAVTVGGRPLRSHRLHVFTTDHRNWHSDGARCRPSQCALAHPAPGADAGTGRNRSSAHPRRFSSASSSEGSSTDCLPTTRSRSRWRSSCCPVSPSSPESSRPAAPRASIPLLR